MKDGSYLRICPFDMLLMILLIIVLKLTHVTMAMLWDNIDFLWLWSCDNIRKEDEECKIWLVKGEAMVLWLD